MSFTKPSLDEDRSVGAACFDKMRPTCALPRKRPEFDAMTDVETCDVHPWRASLAWRPRAHNLPAFHSECADEEHKALVVRGQEMFHDYPASKFR
jgi:hypothetical protein